MTTSPPDSRRSSRTSRLIEASERIAAEPPKTYEFQHSVLCQTSLPHRPTAARTWAREQGNVSLRIEAGGVKHGAHWVDLPLPHGEKPRLVLVYLNTEALRARSPLVDVEDSMTAFVRAVGIEPNGAHIRDFKDQMTRLAAATVRFAVGDEQRTVQGQMQIVEAFDLWWPKDDRQRVMWPSLLCLSDQYFRSLQAHAVPLDPRAIAVLKGSSLCLDVYCWLAQRLHRIHPARSQTISWPALKEQFGADYGRMVDFRAKFVPALRAVWAVYPSAKMEVASDGLTLLHSPPPVPKRRVNGWLLDS
jgi:Plasmid encoded RepA protein